MSTVLHDGPEKGLYDWRLPFVVNRWDPSCEVNVNEVEGSNVTYEATLPKYWGITVKVKVYEHVRFEVDGDASTVQEFRDVVEAEQSELVAAIEEEKSKRA